MNDFSLPNALTSRLTQVATLAALKGGENLRKGFGSTYQILSKEGRHNLVTDYDNMTEEIIISFIKSHFPEHSFLAEESGTSGKEENEDGIKWIIDPLDGTVNFAHNIPMFAVSIAASYKNEILCGVIYHPLLHELFIAEKGKGAFLNGSALKVTDTKVLDHAIVATGFPYNVHENPLHCVDLFANLARMGTPLRRIGSAALDLAYLAAGRFDAFWEVSLKPWDYAAGMLMIKEAGGSFTHFDGSDFQVLSEGPIAATNGLLHDQLLPHLQFHEKLEP